MNLSGISTRWLSTEEGDVSSSVTSSSGRCQETCDVIHPVLNTQDMNECDSNSGAHTAVITVEQLLEFQCGGVAPPTSFASLCVCFCCLVVVDVADKCQRSSTKREDASQQQIIKNAF